MKLANSNEYLACRPLNYWPFSLPTRLFWGIWVIAPFALPPKDDLFWRFALSGHDFDEVQKCNVWLVCPFRDNSIIGTDRKIRAEFLVDQAVIGLMVSGGSAYVAQNIRLLLEKRNGKFAPVSSSVRPRLQLTGWGNITAFGGQSQTQIKRIVADTIRSYRTKTVRLLNALDLFAMGAEANNPYIGIFLWATALDAILMAANLKLFKERLCNVLGPGSFMFPHSVLGQPKYLVQDIAADLFILRSLIAHGQKISPKFLTKTGFEDAAGNDLLTSGYSYTQVLRECSQFAVMAALRKIFSLNLIKMMSDSNAWRTKLSSPF